MAIAAFAAGELIETGDAVFVNNGGLAFKAAAKNQDSASTVGIAIDTGNAGTLIRVNVDALFSQYENLIPGERQFLSIATSGQIVAYSGWQQEFNVYADNAYLQYVGRAVSNSGIEIELSPPVLINYPLP